MLAETKSDPPAPLAVAVAAAAAAAWLWNHCLHIIATPSQTLPDHASDPLKFSATPVSRLVEEDEEDDWNNTLRPGLDVPTSSARLGPSSARTTHSRESSADKIQLQQHPNGGGSAVTSPSAAPAAYSQLHRSSSRSALNSIKERIVDPKAAAYGHHRQTSIVHGIQHSRNGSLASASSSPLSPQMIAAAGASFAERSDMQSAFSRLDADSSGSPALSPSGLLSTSRSPAAMSGTTLAGSVPPGTPGSTHTMQSSGPPTSFALERVASSDTTSSSYAQPGRKLDRPQGQRGRKDASHSQNSSSSRHHQNAVQTIPITVGEHTLEILFTSFESIAEEKLNLCLSTPFGTEPVIENICGPGVDVEFDHQLTALGHLAKRNSKGVIDRIMMWRKVKSDIANDARTKLQELRGGPLGPVPLQRRNTEPVQMSASAGGGEMSANPTAMSKLQEYVAQTERRSTASIYILVRVLLEITTTCTLADITSEMEEKLEAIIFNQAKNAGTDQLLSSPLRMANWNMYSQLLGAMSEISFVSVTDRFFADLKASLDESNFRGPVLGLRSESEDKMELVLLAMRHVRLKLAPSNAWDRSCDFMIAMGKLFSRCHGHKVKSAFCQILEQLLLPVASNASNADLSRPKWAHVLSAISPRLARLFVKPRYWSTAFPLTATMLCVSSPEAFGNQWLQLIYPLQAKLKDRATKATSLQSIARIVWTYLYRTTDTPSNTIRKLEEVQKLVLPSTKRSILASDTAVVEPLVQIIRFIGYKHPEFCFKTIIFPLINAELFTVSRELKVENLEPDRIVVGIRAFLAVISDLERGTMGRPPFPQGFSPFPTPDRTPTSPQLGSPTSVSFSGSAPHASRLRTVSMSTTNGTTDYDERVSRPVATNSLSDTVRDYYSRFCEILGKITIICDNTFGGQAALDEKFSSPGPKTPMADTFNFRRDDHQVPVDQKQSFYELLHVAVQALPRCLSPQIPFNSLINLLCTGTAHVHPNIAESSAQSLKAIARQSHAQQVTSGFSRFIFNFDDRYSTMSDGGMLGPDHIENTLRLYVELLQIWIEEIQRKTRDVSSSDALESTNPMAPADMRGLKLDLSSIWAEVDQIEAHGLFFLCSQSRRVRHFAITVLRLIGKFDTALGKPQTEDKDNLRVIDILENESSQIMNFNDEYLTVAERSRLQRGLKNNGNHGAVIDLCTSDLSYDATLWFKVFPNLIRVINDRCVFAVTIGRDLVCNRILQMYKSITILSEPARGPFNGADPGSARLLAQTPTTQPELLVEQWRLYLVFACTTMQDPGSSSASTGQANQHGRKSSKPTSATDKIVTARTLFKYLNPLLSASSISVREAVVAGMGSINVNIYRTLLEELQGHVSRCNDEARVRIHQRTNSSPRRNKKMDLLRTEITHVYRLTAHFLKRPEVYNDDWILNNLVTYAKEIKIFLMDSEVQLDIEFQRLRRHYCGLVEELYLGINRSSNPTQWMTFEARKSSFALMEDWCGFSPNQTPMYQRDENGRLIPVGQGAVPRGPDSTLTAAMEIEKRHLRTAALSALAALCAGPTSVVMENKSVKEFNMTRMYTWIEDIFRSGNDRMRSIGRQAFKNLIIHNKDNPDLLQHGIDRCYVTDAPHVLECYFEVTIQVLLEHTDYPAPFWRLLGLCLFMLGNEQTETRSKSVQALRALEERLNTGRASKIQDFDISVSDKTKAVYKLAQYKISERLSKQHTEIAVHVFSEYTRVFKDLQPQAQRNVIAVALPWIQSAELKVDPNGGPTVESYVLLANLLEITIKSSSALHNEVQALWQALATGPHPGNVRLILDFIMALCLERREQNFVEYAKQIVVFVASASSAPGPKVIDFLLMQITPKAMVPHEKRDTMPAPPGVDDLYPYCANLNGVLPVGTKQAGFSLGQLSLILLVDLMVSPVNLSPDNVPSLLQVVTVLWDHYTPLVQEQAREMLVHLIHELIVSNLDDRTPEEAKSIENLVELIRRHDKSVVWGYGDRNGKDDSQDSKVPASMEYLTSEVVQTFEVAFPGIKERWGRLSLTWATSCPVRHLACRSFQIFRCTFTVLDQYMLSDMLIRLSNTIADEDPEIRTFSMEILTTLNTLISKLEPDVLLTFPQLFWTTCACLESINEREFLEAQEMLNQFLDKLDFQDATVRRLFLEGQPDKWDGAFEGLQTLLYKGLRSSTCVETTLQTLDKVVRLPSDGLVGNDDRLFFALIANLPRLLHAMEQAGGLSEDVVNATQTLINLALSQGHNGIMMVLDGYLSSTYDRDGADFAAQILGALQETFLPRLDLSMLTMLLGFTTNKKAWMRLKTIRILCTFLPHMDLRQPSIAGHSSDLVSPLQHLLTSAYSMEALEVLDNVTAMPGSWPMDTDQVRVSMSRESFKQVRREYERTQGIFGIPDESGWATPMPAKKTELTRANIHAIFYSCLNAEGDATEPAATPDVEFHDDEYAYPYAYYPAAMDRSDTMMSDDGLRSDTSVAGDLASRLDSLDDFFDDAEGADGSRPSDSRSSIVTVREMRDGFREGFYDGGTGSAGTGYDFPSYPAANPASAMQNAFADRPVGRDGGLGASVSNAMTPGAFSFGTAATTTTTATATSMVAAMASATSSANTLGRPSLHARSVTSPSAPASTTPGVASVSSYLRDFASDDEDDFFSDNEDPVGPNAGPSSLAGMVAAGTSASTNQTQVQVQTQTQTGGMFESFETMMRPLAQSTRSRMRRLTASRSRDEKLPDMSSAGPPGTPVLGSSGMGLAGLASPSSPRVPKVPSAYLSKTQSQPNSDML